MKIFFPHLVIAFLLISAGALSSVVSIVGNYYDTKSTKTLDLSKRRLKALSKNVGLLTQLEELNVSDNNLDDLGDLLKHLPHLKRLNISNNQFQSLPAHLTDLSSLAELDASHNQLTELPVDMNKLAKLTLLNMSYNKFTAIPEQFANDDDAVSQWIGNPIAFIIDGKYYGPDTREIDLSGAGLTTLPKGLYWLKKLEKLNLSNNELTSLNDIDRFRHLKTLDVSHNKLDQFPDALTSITTLSELRAEGNTLTDLPKYMNKLTALRILDLKNNHFETIPDAFFNISCLQEADLSNNSLHELSEKIQFLVNLTTLKLNDNNLSSLPDSIAQASSLTTLELIDNNFVEVPESLGDCAHLTTLRFDGNSVSEPPATFAKLSKLTIAISDDMETLTTWKTWVMLFAKPFQDVTLYIIPFETILAENSLAGIEPLLCHSKVNNQHAAHKEIQKLVNAQIARNTVGTSRKAHINQKNSAKNNESKSRRSKKKQTRR